MSARAPVSVSIHHAKAPPRTVVPRPVPKVQRCYAVPVHKPVETVPVLDVEKSPDDWPTLQDARHMATPQRSKHLLPLSYFRATPAGTGGRQVRAQVPSRGARERLDTCPAVVTSTTKRSFDGRSASLRVPLEPALPVCMEELELEPADRTPRLEQYKQAAPWRRGRASTEAFSPASPCQDKVSPRGPLPTATAPAVAVEAPGVATRERIDAVSRRKSCGSSASNRQILDKSFLMWLEERPPIHRVGSARGRGWEYPLSRSEKCEMLMVNLIAENEDLATENAVVREQVSLVEDPHFSVSSASSPGQVREAADR